MNYNDIFSRSALLDNIPINDERYKFSPDVVTSVILLRVAYAREKKLFEEQMVDVLSALKKEGFDKRAQAIQKMEDIFSRMKAHDEWDGQGERPVKPTDKEISEAEEIRKTAGDFEKEKNELISAYMDAREKKAKEDAGMNSRKLSYEAFMEIVSAIGTHGDIELAGIPMNKASKEEFLQAIAENLVDF